MILTRERRVAWFVLRNGNYEELLPDAEGILRSEVLPGLWLQTSAVWNNDLAALIGTLQQGIATPEHKAFVDALTSRAS